MFPFHVFHATVDRLEVRGPFWPVERRGEMGLLRFRKHPEDIIILPRQCSAMEAIEQMVEDGSAAVLISPGNGKLEGIFTERDAMIKIAATSADPNHVTLGEVMNHEVVTIPEDATLDAAVHCMQLHQITHLPIVRNEDEIVGMITIRHLLHDKIKDLVEELNNLEAYLNDAPGG